MHQTVQPVERSIKSTWEESPLISLCVNHLLLLPCKEKDTHSYEWQNSNSIANYSSTARECKGRVEPTRARHAKQWTIELPAAPISLIVLRWLAGDKIECYWLFQYDFVFWMAKKMLFGCFAIKVNETQEDLRQEISFRFQNYVDRWASKQQL